MLLSKSIVRLGAAAAALVVLTGLPLRAQQAVRLEPLADLLNIAGGEEVSGQHRNVS